MRLAGWSCLGAVEVRKAMDGRIGDDRNGGKVDLRDNRVEQRIRGLVFRSFIHSRLRPPAVAGVSPSD